MRKTALITGVGGQDGSYLAELLLEKQYIVHGLIRYSSTNNNYRICHLDHERFSLHYGDVTNGIIGLIKQIRPDEIYNLAAQSFVPASFLLPRYTADVNATSVLEILEAIRVVDPKIKLFQASTNDMFTDGPRSPYATSKLFAYWMVRNYRDNHGLFAVNGIMFNHESPRRSDCFVTKKVCKGVADIHKGRINYFSLGNLNAKRDWGYARDFVLGMWKMMQQNTPDDYVLCTERCKTVRELVEEAFKYIDIKITWQYKGLDEVGVDQEGIVRIEVHPDNLRISDVDVECVQGDYSKAKNELDWSPSITFEEMIEEMVNVEMLDED
jgi:GDPmannose 4,6-dehydratase